MVRRVIQFIRDAFNFRRLEMRETREAHRKLMKKFEQR